MKPILPSFRVYILIFVLSILLFTCSDQFSQRITVIKHAFNSKDINNTIARYYTDDITFIVDDLRNQGKESLRGVAAWDSVINTRLSFSDFRMAGDTIFCKCVEENEINKLLGLELGYFDPVIFIFQEGLIKYVKFQSTPESHKAEVLAVSSFRNWLYPERYDQLLKLMINGQFVLNANSARGYLELVREWRSTAGQQ
jgi:hypothetical protein